MKDLERRNFSTGKLSVEERAESQTNTIVGHAAVFNSRSQDLGGFVEQIATGAFDSVLEDDVRALFNHNQNFVLGRTVSKTLRLSVDEQGLRYEIDIPNTTVGKDLLESINRGDISQSSFGFIVGEDEWEKTDDGNLRTITKVERLYDVSPVTYPAYPATDAAVRSMENWNKETEIKKNVDEERDLIERDLKRLKTVIKSKY
jgi:hypothetical protein